MFEFESPTIAAINEMAMWCACEKKELAEWRRSSPILNDDCAAIKTSTLWNGRLLLTSMCASWRRRLVKHATLKQWTVRALLAPLACHCFIIIMLCCSRFRMPMPICFCALFIINHKHLFVARAQIHMTACEQGGRDYFKKSNCCQKMWNTIKWKCFGKRDFEIGALVLAECAPRLMPLLPPYLPLNNMQMVNMSTMQIYTYEYIIKWQILSQEIARAPSLSLSWVAWGVCVRACPLLPNFLTMFFFFFENGKRDSFLFLIWGVQIAWTIDYANGGLTWPGLVEYCGNFISFLSSSSSFF